VSDTIIMEEYASHLLSLSRGFMASRVLLSAVELDVFESLGTHRLTAAEIASQCGTDARATEILLNALTGMGLLEKHTAVMGQVLLPDSPDYLSELGYTVHLWDAWSQLTPIVKSGSPVISDWTDEVQRDFALYMKQCARGTARALAKLLDLSKVHSVLDVGGGTGVHAVAMAQQSLQTRVVVLDRSDEALQLAQDDVAREGLQDRIELRKADFFVDDLGQGFDLVLLSSIVCLFEPLQNLSLLRRVRTSLTPGGRVVILDSLVDNSRTRPAAAALFAVNMLVSSHSGESHSQPQVKGWLRSVGFEDIRWAPLASSSIIMARKGREED